MRQVSEWPTLHDAYSVDIDDILTAQLKTKTCILSSHRDLLYIQQLIYLFINCLISDKWWTQEYFTYTCTAASIMVRVNQDHLQIAETFPYMPRKERHHKLDLNTQCLTTDKTGLSSLSTHYKSWKLSSPSLRREMSLLWKSFSFCQISKLSSYIIHPTAV